MTGEFICDDGVRHDWKIIGISGGAIVYYCEKCEKCKHEEIEWVV
jgi:hypothetical protein